MTSWLTLRDLMDSHGGHRQTVGDGRYEICAYVCIGRKAGSTRNGVHSTWPGA